jgi:hypothetical protein
MALLGGIYRLSRTPALPELLIGTLIVKVINRAAFLVICGAAEAQAVLSAFRVQESQRESLHEAGQLAQFSSAKARKNGCKTFLLDGFVLIDETTAFGARRQQGGPPVSRVWLPNDEAQSLQFVNVLGRSWRTHAEEVGDFSHLVSAIEGDEFQQVKLRKRQWRGTYFVEDLLLEDLPDERGKDVGIAQESVEVTIVFGGESFCTVRGDASGGGSAHLVSQVHS